MTDIHIEFIDTVVNKDDYYVYVHRRISDGSIFYVGKGKGNRFKSKYKRSDWWYRSARKHGVLCEIRMVTKSEICAFSYERILISIIGKDNLVNICDGGQGASGLVMPQSTKDKIGSANRGKVKSPSAIEKHKISMLGFKHTEETKAVLRDIALNLISNRPDNYGELVSIGKRHKETYRFIHIDGYTFTGTKYDFRMKYGITSSKVSCITLGKRKSVGGWSCLRLGRP